MKIVRLLVPLIALSVSSFASAQSLLQCLKDGDYLPVASVSSGAPMCFTGDSLLKGKRADLVMSPAESFGEGFVDVEIRKHSREGVVENDGVVQFVSIKGWYLFLCNITPDRDLNDCYYAVCFDTYGLKSYYTRSLGHLKANQTTTLRVYMKLGYEMPDQLHMFSGMEELRTSLVPTGYQYDSGDLVYASN